MKNSAANMKNRNGSLVAPAAVRERMTISLSPASATSAVSLSTLTQMLVRPGKASRATCGMITYHQV